MIITVWKSHKEKKLGADDSRKAANVVQQTKEHHDVRLVATKSSTENHKT